MRVGKRPGMWVGEREKERKVRKKRRKNERRAEEQKEREESVEERECGGRDRKKEIT